MHVDWLKLIPALLFLLIPIGWFHRRHVRFRPLSMDWQGYWGRTLRLGLHTIDFGRAALGGWMLLEALQVLPGAQPTERYSVLLIQVAVLGLATLLQSLVCREPDSAHAPFAFLAGLAFGTMPPLVALFALVLTIALAVGAAAPTGFFPVLVASLAALGFLFEGKKITLDLIPLGLAILLPWLVSLLFHRQFVCAYLSQPRTKASSPLK